MDILRQSFGLVSEGDIVSLSPGFDLRGNVLYDVATGANHTVATPALRSVELLASGRTVQDWIESNELDQSASLEILQFLDSIAGLSIKLTLVNTTRVRWYRLNLLVRGLPVAVNSKRYDPTLVSLVRMVGSATSQICIIILFGIILVYGANLSISLYLMTQTIFILSLIISTILHEATHWKITGREAEGAFVRRGLRLGFLHGLISRELEVRSAFFGPLAGTLGAATVGFVVLLFRAPLAVIAPAWLVAAFHLLSWLPFYGDGQTLIKEWRIRHA